jgi:hypothetical protein
MRITAVPSRAVSGERGAPASVMRRRLSCSWGLPVVPWGSSTHGTYGRKRPNEHAVCLHATDVCLDLGHAIDEREEALVEDDEHLVVRRHAYTVRDAVE